MNRLRLLLILGSMAGTSAGAEGRSDAEWVVDRSFRVPVKVDPGDLPRRHAPLGAELDFADLLRSHGIPGRLDRNSIRVVRYDPATGRALPYLPDCAEYSVPYQLSRDFFYEDQGTVWWRIQNANDLHFHLYFDTLQRSPRQAPENLALVGVGDLFHYNSGRPGPLDVSMSASLRYVDWDGDGRKDLLVGSSQTHEYGVPYDRGYIYFFKNIGTAEEPLFAPGFQLRDEEGDYIAPPSGKYMYFEVYDWNKNGEPDIVIGVKNRLHWYENTGRRDSDSLPVFRPRQLAVELAHGNDYLEQYSYRFFRLVDWNGDGRTDLLYSIYAQQMDPDCDRTEQVCYWNEVLELFEVHLNIGSEDSQPEFAAPKIVRTARGLPLARFGYGGADYVDWNGNGLFDLITTDMLNHPHGACRVLFHENFGTRAEPKFLLEVPMVARAEDFGIDPNPHVVDWNGNGNLDLLLAGFEGWIKVYLNAGSASEPVPQLEEGRFVLQTHPRISEGEQARTAVADWNGNGVYDLIRGGGNGWINLYENRGTNADPVFAPPIRLQAGGEEIRMINGLRDCPQGPSEPNSGYTTPVVVDFDGDGHLDLIVGDMRGYQTYFENVGTRTLPKLAAGRRIELEGEPRCFGWRNQVAVGDLNGDGEVEIVTTPFSGRREVWAYRRAAEQPDPARLIVERAYPLRMENGEILVPPHAGGNNSGDTMLKLVDWTGNGVLDLLYTSIHHNSWFENVGTQEQPLFRDRGRIQVDGEDLIVSGHANTIDAVDWTGDGRMDLILSGESGWLHYFERSFIEGTLPAAVTMTLEKRPE